MPTIEAHGIAAGPPRGWDAQIYVRPPAPVPPASPDGEAGADAARRTAGPAGELEVTRPVAHLANFALPPGRADMGGGAVELMDSGGVFIAICEFGPEDARTPVFDHPPPWPLSPDDFAPDQLQRMLDGQAGCQRFFRVGDRAFCLYVVIGSHRQRGLLVQVANEALAGVRFA